MWNFYFDGKWGKFQNPNLFGTCTLPHDAVKKFQVFCLLLFEDTLTSSHKTVPVGINVFLTIFGILLDDRRIRILTSD